MANGKHISKLINAKKTAPEPYRTNIYVTKEIYVRFQETCRRMNLTVSESFDSLMLDFIDSNTPVNVVDLSHTPKALNEKGE